MSLTDNINFPSLSDNVGVKWLTITLKPELYKRTVRKQFLLTVTAIESGLRTYNDEYILIPEVTKAGNIHYHCMIRPANHIAYALDKYRDAVRLSNKIGLIHIDPNDIINFDAVKDYMMKDYNKTNALINMKKGDHEILRHWKRSKKVKKQLITFNLDRFYESDTEDLINQHFMKVDIQREEMRDSNGEYYN